MKRILTLWALAALLLTSCHSLRTKTYQDNLEMPLMEEQTDSLLFDISLEYATGGVGDEAKDAMNAAIVRLAFDLEEPDATLEEAAIRYRENLIDDYITENGGGGPGVLTWEDKINGVFTGKFRNWENYLLSYYSFRGGAHGIQTVCNLVFDRKTGALVTEADIFADDYLQPVADLLREAVRKEMEAEDAELLPLVEMENVVPNGNFSVGKKGIQWIFQPYEVGPYALGLVMGTVSWRELHPYLRSTANKRRDIMEGMESYRMHT